MATWDLALGNVLGVAAAGLIILLGSFVLIARPTGVVNRVFFLFAFTDGMSTGLFAMRNIVPDVPAKIFFNGAYWWFFTPFVALLLGFGLLLPRSGLPRWGRLSVAWGLTGATTALLVAYAVDHDLFWTLDAAGGTATFPRGGVGFAVFMGFILGAQAVMVRLALAFRRAASPSRVRQAAYVLSGVAVGYAPFATTALMGALAAPDATFLAPALGRRLLSLAYLLMVPVLIAVGVISLTAGGETQRRHHRVIGGALALVVVLTVAAVMDPTPAGQLLLHTMGLVAYPVLLGYAIVRYDVIDIDVRLRRAATIGLTGAAIAGVFVVVGELLEGILADRVLGALPGASIVAALTATAVAYPVLKRVRSMLARLVPDLAPDDVRRRKSEIYRHTLEGAMADGTFDEREARTLQALRSTLGITAREHETMLAELGRRVEA